MIQTGFEKRVSVQQIIENQLPEFVLSESPKAVDFLKQYYLSQEHQGGAADIAVNLDQYLKVDNLTPEVISGETTLYSDISTSDTTVQVYSTKGFPNENGLFKIDDEIFTYTGLTTNTFTGVIRGFSGITSYRTDLNAEELIFSDTSAATHTATTKVQNLSALFLKDFYRKLKYTYTPGLEDVDFQSNLDVNNFIKEARTLYETKGTEESFRILFNVLYGVDPKVIDLENYLPKPSSAEFLRREIVVAERISGNPAKLVGQTIRKSTDDATQGSVSEVEVFTRSGIKTYYKIGLFVGYDDNALIEGTWEVQPKSKVINPVAVSDSIITVDSTVGFGATGTLVAGTNTITYTDKTVNQFLGCSGVVSGIGTADEIRTNEVFYGYEDGDTSKKVEIRLGGVLSDFKIVNDILDTSEEQVLYVKNVGERIKNPETDKSNKEIFANSWIYNTSNRFDIEDINTGSSTITLKSSIDKAQLKVGDKIDILLGTTENIGFSNASIQVINAPLKQVILGNISGFNYDPTQTYTIRRKVNTATSSGTPITYGQNKVIADIQNVYNENDESFYVASNSLPSYDITESTVKYSIDTSSPTALQDFDANTQKFTTISFPQAVLDFITGDKVYYKPETVSLEGISEGFYYVKVLSGGKIKLYQSLALIAADTSVGFKANGTNNHDFILAGQEDDSISPQALLKKFPSSQNLKSGTSTKTIPGSTGMLINGVEIFNYKSLDKVYYGPIEKINVYNAGKDYDVLNLPSITVAAGAGVTAKIQPVVSGSVKEVLVDPQDFDVDSVDSVTIAGGNGSGANFLPMTGFRQREVEFDCRADLYGGGLSLSNNSVTFTKDHNFVQGEELVYDSNGNTALGIGTTGLTNNSIYYPEIVSSKTIKLYTSVGDLDAGTGIVPLNANTQGIHKFKKARLTKTLRAIKVLDGGSGYTNRKLIVDPVGVNTISDTINFDGHGFNDGDAVVYSADGTVISGLTTAHQYHVIKVDDNSFRLASAGVGGTITSNFTRKNYVSLASSGVGYHNFAYPDIVLTVNASIASTVGVITATPLIRGEIIDAYLYDKGNGYGSDILNFDKNPIVTVKSGKDAELKPIIVGGKVDKVQVQYGGLEYTSSPDFTFTGIGSGIGAKVRGIIEDGKIVDVVIINPGVNYSANTGVAVTSVGSNAYIESHIRSLTVSNAGRFGNEILTENNDKLAYGFVGHSTAIAQSNFGDSLDGHSPIIGWAYDGNPIYGPNGYSDPNDENSALKYLNTGYVLSSSDIVDRPSGFSAGFFVEDYKYNGSGDLDEHNGRYTKTPEYPNGVYAYFAGITTITREPKFPYFIGDSYRSPLVEQKVDQSFNFNNSDLIRNTFPYKSKDLTANNDFISEPYETIQQRSVVKSVSKGSVDELIVNESGSEYAINDIAEFDNTGTKGGGLNAYVSDLKGKTIRSIDTTVETFQDSLIVWDNSSQVTVKTSSIHGFLDEDNIVISGLSTYVAGLTKSHKIGITSESAYLTAPVASNTTVGMVTDIYVSSMPNNISVGSTVGIGTIPELVSVLNVFRNRNVVRIVRGTNTGTAHTASTLISKIADTFTLPVSVKQFDSKVNEKVYFNPTQAVGLGTTAGGDASREFQVGNTVESLSVPYQSIYLPDHKFTHNQQVTFSKTNAGWQNILVSTSPDNATTALPVSGSSQTMYIVNKGKDYIGLTTAVGFNTSGLYFRAFTPNGDVRDWKYYIESDYTQQTARVEKITSIVGVTTAHGLLNGDTINLSLKSKRSIGVGNSAAVKVAYNAENDKITVGLTTFTESVLNATKNEITLTSHGFKTGDKVFYNTTTVQPITGLGTGAYYVYRIDDDKFNLSSTRLDSIAEPPTILDLSAPVTASPGGIIGHELSKINPQLEVIDNNNLVFDLSDSSLADYDLRLFYDDAFDNELVSVGGTITEFNVERSIVKPGNVGAALTLTYSTTLPSKLFYTLERSGFISTADTDVSNNSEIIFTPSVYDGTYSVAGVGTTSFKLSLKGVPESLSYTNVTSSLMDYTTPSTTARGGVHAMRITSGGLNYKSLPKFTQIKSTAGLNADIIPQSSTVGRIKEVDIQDPGFDYSGDKTLNPEVFISPSITVVDRNVISDVTIVSGGSGYTYAPDVVVVNPNTGEIYTDGFMTAELQGSSISKINILQSPRGLSDTVNVVRTINNTNSIGIEKIESSLSGIVTCTLTTPINGFSVPPFSASDQVFVEGIEKLAGFSSTGIGTTSSGSGFNSADYGYAFFPVDSIVNANPFKVKFNLGEATTGYPGIAKTDQNGFATIVKESDYPTFKVTQTPLDFILEERLQVLQGSTYISEDLYITLNLSDQIKVRGTYELKAGDLIRGTESGTVATIKKVVENKAIFKIDYSLRRDYGWSNDTGKLDEDHQVLPDNDYYQNLSYAIQSPIEYEELSNPVNRLLHTTGLKNFADTGITTTTNITVQTPSDSGSVALIDIISDKRVDTVSNFDFGIDLDATSTKSRYVKFQNKRLSDYINCETNRVLKIDDIGPFFSKADPLPNLYANIDTIALGAGYNRYLVQLVNPDNDERQITEVITLTDNSGDIFTFEKGSVGIATTGSNNNYKVTRLGDISGYSADGKGYLRFDPEDPYNNNYDIKVIRNQFVSNVAGTGNTSFGFVTLTGTTSNVGIGNTAEIISAQVVDNEGFFANVEVINQLTDDTTYVELYVDQDGTDTYISDFYVDNKEGANGNFIGTFGGSISSGVVKVNFTNSTETNPVLVRSRVVGFGTTASGIGTHRFLTTGQSAGTEETARYESKFAYTPAPATPTTIFSTTKADVTSIKSIVKVGYGNTSALHQLLSVHNGGDVYTTQFPFLSIGGDTGIGTFGSEFSGSNIILKFYPDSGINDVVLVQAYSELIQTEQDLVNIPQDHVFGTVGERHLTSAFNGINGARVNVTEFDLKHNGIDIFSKTFNPGTVATLGSGTFVIKDHFFETGEELSYVSGSTFSNVSPTSMVMSNGSVLPATVYAIKVTSDEFQLATSKSNATAGTAITFNTAGAGNAHKLGMKKKASKTIMSLDGIVQSPLTYTPVNYTLTDNFGSISATDTFASLSGISSILPGDVLKIDDEFTKVKTVGLGTTAVGPITETGAYNLVELERGFVGTTAASHSDAATARVYLGAYNIIDSKINFTEAPTGNNITVIDPTTNLATPRATFGGRVYLRQDYTNNQVYDNISKQFTGIGATYTLTVEGANNTGIETGSGIVFVNNIFQTPTTTNNTGNNWELTQPSGRSDIKFTGITDDNGQLIISDYDVNKNQLPRGGMIVSLGSSIGRGYAQPVGASVTAVLNTSGAITAVGIGTTDINGSGYRGTVGVGVTDEAYTHRFVRCSANCVTGSGGPFTPTGASYESHTGKLTLTIPSHGRSSGNVQLVNNSIVFTCSRDNYRSEHTYPRTTDPAANGNNLALTKIDDDTISINVGAGGGKGKGATVTATVGAGGTIVFGVSAGGQNYVNPRINVPSPSYSNLGVVGVSRRGIGSTTDTGIGLLLDVEVGPTDALPVNNKAGDASDLIDANSAFISELAARRMFNRWNNGSNSSYSYPSGFTEQDCIDDVVDVLDATAHNVKFGGNDKTYDAANLFVTGVYSNPAPVTGEEEQVIYALHEARDMAQRAMRNEKIYKHLGAQYAHTYTSGTVANAVVSGGNYAHTYQAADSSSTAINGSKKPTQAVYDAVAGTLQLTFATAHGVANGGNVTIADNSLVFTCARDGHATKHSYPRATDPASGATLTATVSSTTVLTVTVGTSPLVFKSVVAGAGAEATSYDAKTGDLVLNVGSNHGFLAPTTLNAPTTATYAPSTGVLRLTITGHGCSVGDYIKIDDNSLTFTCARDNNTTQHSYPLSRSSVSGTWLPIHQVSANRIWVNIGQSPDTSAHTFVSATAGVKKANAGIGIGTSKLGFKCTRDANAANPQGVAQQLYPRPGDPFSWNKKQISIASTTTSSVTVNVGVSSTSQTSKSQTFDNTVTVDTADPKCATIASSINTLVGIVTAVIKTHNSSQLPASRTVSAIETYEVNDFSITRPGYGFKPGDVFKPVGLVTDRNLSSLSEEFSLTVVDTFTDGFAAWQFGELDYIDTIKDLQNGKRVRFPLKYNGDLLSFETSNPDVDLNSVLLIFVNGVIQEPGEHYTFDGGTSFILGRPPQGADAEGNEGDDVTVFFYRGTRGSDSKYIDINESLKVGDDIQLKTTGAFQGQDTRTISGISSSDKIQTNLYTGRHIDEVNYRLIDWNKQKVDKTIEGERIYKTRDSIEGLVYPTARVIGDLPSSGISTIYVDDARFFNYEEEDPATSVNIVEVGAFIMQQDSGVGAAVTATVSGLGTISALTVTNGGSGYTGNHVEVAIAYPAGYGVTFSGGKAVYTGIASALVPVVSGSLSGVSSITSIGAGYTWSAAPSVIVPHPTTPTKELITGINTVRGFSGIVTGITTSHSGSELYVNFQISNGDSGQNIENTGDNALKIGYPINITGTTVGPVAFGVTSIDGHENSVVGIGTSMLDNVYKVLHFTKFNNQTGIITCRIQTAAHIPGIAATSGISTGDIGRFSWGALEFDNANVDGKATRLSPVGVAVTGNYLNVGLSSFPTIQRRSYGIRSSGALRKDLG